MKYLFIFASLITLFICGSVYLTYKAQFNLFFPKLALDPINSLDEFDSQFSYFPNITPTALPIKALRAAYALNQKDYYLGNKLLIEAQIDNPYIGFPELVRARAYYDQGNIDSATYYSELAFIKWPKSFDNFKFYLKTLAYQGDTLAIVDAYSKIEDVFRDRVKFGDEFINSYSNAKVKYLITNYPDMSDVDPFFLEGTWNKAFDFEGGKVRYDSLIKLTFKNNILISSNNVEFNYNLVQDTLYVYSKTNNKLLSKNLLKFSKKYSTLILTSDPRAKKVEQFFKKQ